MRRSRGMKRAKWDSVVKQAVRLSDEVLKEMHQEGERLNRNLSWLTRTAWRLARKDIQAIPSTDDVLCEVMRESARRVAA